MMTVGEMPMPAGFRYRDVFLRGRPHHQKYDAFWRKHPPMTPQRWAKIYAPFDALDGFDECISARNVLYSGRKNLSADERELLERKLSVLNTLIRRAGPGDEPPPQVSVTFFRPCADFCIESYNRSGSYETVTGPVRQIDPVLAHTITIAEQTILLSDIVDINSPLFCTAEAP